MKSEPVLCFIDNNWAYFTTAPLEKQWGDDWEDAPYEHNAGSPYVMPGYEIVKVAWHGPFESPADRYNNNSLWSVKDINNKRVPWLLPFSWASKEALSIVAGTTLSEFKKIIRQEADGQVYEVVK